MPHPSPIAGVSPNPFARRDVLKAAAAAVAGTLPLSSAFAQNKPAEPQRPAIEGYLLPLSVKAKDKVRLHVSTTSPYFSVEIARVGATREVVWTKDAVAGKNYPVPPDASTHGCRWPAAVELDVPTTWRTGYYSVKLRATGVGGDKGEGDAFFVVRPDHPGRDAKILLQLTTNTYDAYNDWGGSSLYVGGSEPLQGVRVSFERPLPRGFLSKPSGQLNRWSPYAGWHNWERAFVAWAEQAGYKIDYAINSDLEFHRELLTHYRLVLSVGHDEYWSRPMRDNLEAFIERGGNVAFFSGNTCYWQVRSESDGKALISYKRRYLEDPYFKSENYAELSTLWSNRLIRRPENQLTGVSFNYGGYHRFRSVPRGAGGYTIHRPEHWIFDGTELKWGDLLGTENQIVGYECDGCDFVVRNNLPVPTHRDGTPDTFQILGTAPAQGWENEVNFAVEGLFGPDATQEEIDRIIRGSAVLGIYTRGGTVFTTGCTEWSRGLEQDNPLVDRITRNLLDRLSGPT